MVTDAWTMTSLQTVHIFKQPNTYDVNIHQLHVIII